MDDDPWTARLSSVSKRYQSALGSRSDLFMAFEEIDADDDTREQFPCPFCSECFDIVGLCFHIDDEHHVDANDGVCPICAIGVRVDMVAHITLQHGNMFKIQRRRKLRKGGSHSTLSLLRKELREGNLQSLLGGASFLLSSTNAAPDPVLSSFILPMVDELVNAQPQSLAEATPAKRGGDEYMTERKVQSSPLSVKDQEEKARRSEFVHELVLSTIF